MAAVVGHVDVRVIRIKQRIADTAATGVVVGEAEVIEERLRRQQWLALHRIDNTVEDMLQILAAAKDIGHKGLLCRRISRACSSDRP